MAELGLKIDVDTSDIDVALAKAEQLKAALEQIKVLQAEVASWPMPEPARQFAREVEVEIERGLRVPMPRFKL